MTITTPLNCCPCERLQTNINNKTINNTNHKSVNTSSKDKYCKECIKKVLKDEILNYKEAKLKRDELRQRCSSTLSYNNPENNNSDTSVKALEKVLTQHQKEYQLLQNHLQNLRSECSSTSVTLASLSVTNEQRIMSLSQKNDLVSQTRENLETFSSIMLSSSHHGSLTHLFQDRVQQVKKHRLRLALQIFDMHRMDVGAEYNDLTLDDFAKVEKKHQHQQNNINKQESRTNSNTESTTTTSSSTTKESSSSFQKNPQLSRRLQNKVPSGIGKIGGLPLPHAGMALYSVLPSPVLTSSLRLVASLTNLLARCLGIVLPHPILLRPLIDHNLSSSSSSSHHGGNHNCISTTSNRNDVILSPLDRETGDILLHVTTQSDWMQKQSTVQPNNGKNPLAKELKDVLSIQDLYDLGTSDDSIGDNHGNNTQSIASLMSTTNNDKVITTTSQQPLITSRSSSFLSNSNPDNFSINTNNNLSNTITPISNAISSSTHSLMSLVSSSKILGRSARKAFDKMKNAQYHLSQQSSQYLPTTSDYSEHPKGNHHLFSKSDLDADSNSMYSKSGVNNDHHYNLNKSGSSSSLSSITPCMDKEFVSQRIQSASCAVICESDLRSPLHSTTSGMNVTSKMHQGGISPNKPKSKLNKHMDPAVVKYELRPPRYNDPSNTDREALQRQEENFTTGLQLLQNDIITLSINAGVPPACMWPAEALLLNLHSLKLFCLEQYKS